jgi:primary-amine oxidase
VPFWEQDGRIISWLSILENSGPAVSSPTLLPLGVSLKLDLTSRNWEEWQVVGWYSQGSFYATTKEFRAAINSYVSASSPPNLDGNWTSTDMQGVPLPLDDLPPPVSVSQGSQRFKVDVEADYIEWMDFSFYHSVSWDIGLSLFNIQYQGTRLMYELSLQDAIAAYAGSDPSSSQQTFFDTQVGMGSYLQPLVKGYDCPGHATYLNATWTEGNTTKTQPDAICIFEYDTGYPIRRHSFSPAGPHTSVAKNIVFTMRTIATVGNYDYMIEYNFFYDGAIEVSVRASGYISAAFWENQPEYGFHIHDFLTGSLHDHALTFKADLDIMGTKNSVQKIEIVPTSTTYPWSQGRIHDTFKAERSWVVNESESSIDWSPNDATIYAIVNKDTPNRFGEYPGYRMKRAAGTAHLTARTSSNILKAGAFASHDFYITQQKDTEPRASDPNNFYAPKDPLVDFATFLNDESLEQEDL